MFEVLLNLPAVLGCLIFMVTAVVTGLSIYIASHWLLFKDKQTELGDATRTIFLAVNLLVGLFLSLTLTDVLDDLDAIKSAVEREAVAISDTYHGLRHFDSPVAQEIQLQLIDYTTAIIEDDWPALEEARLGVRAGLLLRELGTAVLSLEVNDRIEESSWHRISADVDLMSDLRLARLQRTQTPPPVFLLVVVCGAFVVMLCLGVYRPTRTLYILVSAYLAFFGLVVYLIMALSDPFQGVPGIPTTPLDFVLQEMQNIHQSKS